MGYSTEMVVIWNRRFAATIVIALAAFIFPALSSAQMIHGLTPGSDRTGLLPFGTPETTKTLAGFTTNHYRLTNGVDFSATIEISSNRIVSLQESWMGSGVGPSAGFGDFHFGESKFSEVKALTASYGILYKNIPPVVATPSGSVEFSAFYGVAASANVIRFVTSLDREALGTLSARYGDRAYENAAFSAVLRSLTVETKDYLERSAGSASVRDIGYIPVSWPPLSATPNVATPSISLARIKPSQLPVFRVYDGPRNFPDFTGRDNKFSRYRTTITNEMTSGPTFAGEYLIMQIRCGSECSFVYVANSRTGEVFDAPVGGQNYLHLKLKYELKSKLMISQWADNAANKCFLQFFSFDDGEWLELLKREVGTLDACSKEVAENIR